MSITLEAPMRMKSRGQAVSAVEALGRIRPGSVVRVVISADSRLTTSYVSQLLTSLAVDRQARVEFRQASPWARSMIEGIAAELSVRDRVTVC